jgi:hypothetical protein
MLSLIDQTRSRIDGLTRTIEGLKAVDFPFSDSGKVLEIIEKEFQRIRSDVVTQNVDANSVAARTLCRRALEAIQNYLPVLGFISRSSDLDSPVELHGPLVRLTKRAIQADALLVIFSEWNFSPFTFLFPELTKRGVVLVGMPRSEAHNALIAPLAGHELGHNIWQKTNQRTKYETAALKIVIDAMTANFDKWKRLLGLSDPKQLSDLMGSTYWEAPVTWSVRQAEETFCDLIGLLIFREAYLHAFQYLLAPGESARRSYDYPNLRDRTRVLADAANKIGIPVSPTYKDNFEEGKVSAEEVISEYVALADLTCSKLIDQLLADAQQVVADRKLSAYSPGEVAKAKASLNRAVPASGLSGIENILIAAWEHALDMKNFLGKDLPSIKEVDKEVVLHELVLKSFEVFEVEQKQAAA